MEFRNVAKGLVGLLGAGAVAFGMSGEAKGDILKIEPKIKGPPNIGILKIINKEGASERWTQRWTQLSRPLITNS